MKPVLFSRYRANAVCGAILFVGLLITAIEGYAWTGVVLSAGSAIAIRQLLRGRPYDTALSVLVFGLPLIIDYDWLDVIAAPAALTLIVRESLHIRRETAREREEELRAEIEEEHGG